MGVAAFSGVSGSPLDFTYGALRAGGVALQQRAAGLAEPDSNAILIGDIQAKSKGLSDGRLAELAVDTIAPDDSPGH